MKRAVGPGLALGLFLATSSASALELGTPASAHPYHSAQNFAFELRFSPYYAAVDDEPGLSAQPFKKDFGTSPRLYVGVEFDWQTLRIPYLGTIGPGIGIGTVSYSREARTLTGRASSDDYSLAIYPIYLAAVLRVDTFWRGADFPLVPYGKLGLAVGLWKASDAAGTSTANGVKGSGASFGTNAAVGLALPLDFLDFGAARAMDSASGINNTYLYAEYYALTLNGLGQSNALYVGSSSWAAGLAFEF